MPALLSELPDFRVATPGQGPGLRPGAKYLHHFVVGWDPTEMSSYPDIFLLLTLVKMTPPPHLGLGSKHHRYNVVSK